MITTSAPLPVKFKRQQCEHTTTNHPAIQGPVVERRKLTVNPYKIVPPYHYIYTENGTYIVFGPGFPGGFEHKSITKIRKMIDLMAYEYAT